ncbi:MULTISPECIES: PAS-domain containing protein [unclassified Paracoccus (in: a-proteobacteria)]|uniref:PAS-domain containing protein n=1 Tax=unclassified Paracoccus (in: a-proteobacteria) TaxID=2688777 RepID=UPI0012B1D073|nr:MULTISPECIES: PAS-domain containing protein [unclassified Paracoccus (in: a-proteobacteria)]UXU75706.1 PAS-domain containing protein [Paracoccus sp. SMMA_5]UXU81612.1 PAS-domain containing protein [Paracoccus sp. SMMA_5_TC]
MSQDRHSELTRSGLNLIRQAISIFDAELRLAVCNRTYQAMFDLPDELTRPGTTFEQTIRFLVARGEYGPQEDPEAAVHERVAQARTFQPHYMERRRADGRWISVEGAPLSQGGWIAVYTDITHIKRQEQLLRARSEELSESVLTHAERLAAANRALAATNAALEEAKRVLTESEARTRQVTAMVPAHIAHMDHNYRYTFSNNQISAVFPGADAAILGRDGASVLGAETFDRIRPHMDRAIAGQPQVFEITHPPSGRRIRIALTPDQAGRGAYILSTDVSAEVQAREALSHAAKRALAAQLTSGLAHDFGNLLTIILGLQGRLARAPLTPDQAEDVQATLAAARRGVALLDGIAALTGERNQHPQPVDLSVLFEELAAMTRPTLGEGVLLRHQVIDLPARVMLDPGALQDALLNLMLNARDAMQGVGRILLQARGAGRWLEITVTDSGPGFSPEALARGTEPFFTTKGAQGTGLGLAMVYDQIKLAGGTLRLLNVAEGAQVRIRLPLRAARPHLVLLAEDDPLIRETTREMLTAQGHSVIEAASLAEARELTDLPGLTLILSDLQLGDGSGASLGAAGLPLVLMTALPPDDPRRAGLDCPVLTKPFDEMQLAEALGSFHD